MRRPRPFPLTREARTVFGGFGVWEVVLVLGLVILLFGGKKIPQLARGIGSAIRNFKGELGKGSTGPDGDGSGELPGSDRREP